MSPDPVKTQVPDQLCENVTKDIHVPLTMVRGKLEGTSLWLSWLAGGVNVIVGGPDCP